MHKQLCGCKLCNTVTSLQKTLKWILFQNFEAADTKC
jgi:hypothetical protein